MRKLWTTIIITLIATAGAFLSAQPVVKRDPIIATVKAPAVIKAKTFKTRDLLGEVEAKAVAVVAPKVEAAPLPVSSSLVANCGDNFYANYIYMHESGCRTSNPNGSGCDGIGQACPASKVIGLCGYDYACQNAWFTNYANKYGGWAGSYAFWLTNHWW